jgi:hypothetical protein
LCAQPGHVGGDRGPHLERRQPVAGRVRPGVRVLGQQREHVQAGAAPEVEHLSAAALRDLDQPDLREPLERLAHDVPVHAEDLRQRPLGRQARAGRVALLHDLRDELLEDLIGQRETADGA